MYKTYLLFTLFTLVKVYNKFHKCLGGNALNTWNGLISGAKNKTIFENSLEELVKALLTDNVYKEQLEYLNKTQNTFNMSAHACINYMKVINAYLLTMKKRCQASTET